MGEKSSFSQLLHTSEPTQITDINGKNQCLKMLLGLFIKQKSYFSFPHISCEFSWYKLVQTFWLHHKKKTIGRPSFLLLQKELRWLLGFVKTFFSGVETVALYAHWTGLGLKSWNDGCVLPAQLLPSAFSFWDKVSIVILHTLFRPA